MFSFPFFTRRNGLRVPRPASELEPQEVLLDRLSQKQEAEQTGERRLEVPLSRTLLKVLYGVFLLAAAVFAGKSALLQIGAHEEMARAAAENTVRTIPTFAERGVVYDRFMEQLAYNASSFDLVCDRRDMPYERETFEELEHVLRDREFADIKQEFDEAELPKVLVQKNLSHEQLVRWETRESEIPGCEVQENIIREYREGPVFSHLIGYTAAATREELKEGGHFIGESTGKMGLEKSYQDVLRGEPGRYVIEKDAFGTVIAERGTAESSPGKSVVLWTDAGLQRKLTEALQESMRIDGTKKATAVALDPDTGGVLALVSLPSFDNNMFSGAIRQEDWERLSRDELNPLFNRAIGGLGYPTGSTIKPFIALAALEERVITEDTTLFAPLQLCVPHQYTGEEQCFADWRFHGNTDVRRAIAESVNPFFYLVGGGHRDYEQLDPLGPFKIKEYLETFGWGGPTGIDLPSEGEGTLPRFGENWRLGDTYHFSIGQGPFAVTPLQVASAFAAIANGGTLYEPRVVHKIVDEEQRLVEEIQPHKKQELPFSPENLQIVREGMRQTVTNGTAAAFLNSLPVSVASKTGTAQTGRTDERGEDFLYTWTTAFAPFEDPEILLVVVVEDAQATRAAALPVVRDALRWYFERTQ